MLFSFAFSYSIVCFKITKNNENIEAVISKKNINPPRPTSYCEKIDGKFSFKAINICGLVDFLLNAEKATFSLPKEQVMFGYTIEDYSSEDDFDECNAYWQFQSKKKSKN